MAVLKKEDFFNLIKARIGEDTSDESIKFMEDVTDTYNNLESQASGENEWKRKYEENDKKWRETYINRFYSSDDKTPPAPDSPADPDDNKLTYDKLFTVKEI